MKAVGIAGWSGSGKTTFIESAIAALVRHGVRVATIKHAHKRFDMDREGKDSHRHRTAGAHQVLVTSPDRWALLTEHGPSAQPDLKTAIGLLDPADVVLVEGYRGSAIDKIEVWRTGRGGDPLWPTDPCVIAVASDAAAADLPAPLSGRPLLSLDDPEAAAAYIQSLISPAV